MATTLPDGSVEHSWHPLVDAGAWLGFTFRSDPVQLVGGPSRASSVFLLAYRLACARAVAEALEEQRPGGAGGGPTD